MGDFRRRVEGIDKLVQTKIQHADKSLFSALEPNDILFIDTSHVAKAGSDVNYLLFEILPILKPGVLVHIHDIFLPDEYPKKWVIEDGRNWNEQYLVRAFLQYNPAFEIVWPEKIEVISERDRKCPNFEG